VKGLCRPKKAFQRLPPLAKMSSSACPTCQQRSRRH
jgi:hypothetical protein